MRFSSTCLVSFAVSHEFRVIQIHWIWSVFFCSHLTLIGHSQVDSRGKKTFPFRVSAITTAPINEYFGDGIVWLVCMSRIVKINFLSNDILTSLSVNYELNDTDGKKSICIFGWQTIKAIKTIYSNE